MSDHIPYDPNCLHCRRDAGKDFAGVTRLCEAHKDAQLAAFQPYLKDGETPIERLERERHDNDLLLGALAKEKAHVETVVRVEGQRVAARDKEIADLQIERSLADKATAAARADRDRFQRDLAEAREKLAEREATVDILVQRVHERDAELGELKQSVKTEHRFTNDYIKALHKAERQRAEARALLRECARVVADVHRVLVDLRGNTSDRRDLEALLARLDACLGPEVMR